MANLLAEKVFRKCNSSILRQHTVNQFFLCVLSMSVSPAALSYNRAFGANVFYHGATAPVGQGNPIIEDSRSHSDTPQSVGLLWTSNQPVAEIST
jgi:hypothetical protein